MRAIFYAKGGEKYMRFLEGARFCDSFGQFKHLFESVVTTPKPVDKPVETVNELEKADEKPEDKTGYT